MNERVDEVSVKTTAAVGCSCEADEQYTVLPSRVLEGQIPLPPLSRNEPHLSRMTA